MPEKVDSWKHLEDKEFHNDEPATTAIEAECAVIGCLLINDEMFEEVEDLLHPSYFCDKRNRIIYREALALRKKGHVDPLILKDDLVSKKLIKQAGGDEYIANLADIGGAPVNVRTYAELVQEKAFLRELTTAYYGALALCHKPEGKDTLAVLDEAEAGIYSIADKFKKSQSSSVSLKEVAEGITERIAENSDNMAALRGVSTGFLRLNNALNGLNGGNLIILAGRPGMGKTAFAIHLVRNVAEAGKGVLIFSLEMTADEIGMRFMAQHGLNMTKLKAADKVSSETLGQLATASAEVEKLPVEIDDGGDLNILETRVKSRAVRRLFEERNQELGLIVIDYLQLMNAPGYKENRVLEVSAISKGLKALAKELNLPILALSQLNRGIERRTDPRPVLSDLRDSGSIEQDADAILFLHRKGDEEEVAGRVETSLIVGKNRHGPIGAIKMDFDKPLSKFTERPIESKA